MARLSYTFVLALALHAGAEATPQELMESADRAFSLSLDEEALTGYLEAFQIEPTPALQERIAEIYLELGQPNAALQILEKPTRHPILYAQAQLQLGLWDEALATLADLPDETSVELQRCEILFQKGDWDAARAKLETLPHNLPTTALLLARLDLAQKSPEAAQKRLEPLLRTKPVEAAFLMGEAHFALQQFEQAAMQYQKVAWLEKAQRRLADCALRLAEVQGASVKKFEQAEAIYRQLAERFPSDESTLALGCCLLSKAKHLQDHQAYMAAESLLSDPALRTPESRTKALLICAEAAPSYANREQIYQALTATPHPDPSTAAQCWLLRGRNDMAYAQELRQKKQELEAEHHLEKAASAFTKAMDHARGQDPLALEEALLDLVHCRIAQSSRAAADQALISLTQTLSQIRESPQLLYLRGLLLANRSDATETEVVAALQVVGARHPQNPWAEQAQKLLGMWYYQRGQYTQAHDVLCGLAEREPKSPHAAESLFWAAASAEAGSPHSLERACSLRTQLYEKYPESPFAGEAYFYRYSYEDYLSGNKAAITHLEQMPQRFPDSPFLITAYYLRGQDYKRALAEGSRKRRVNWNQIIDVFQASETQFERLSNIEAIPEEQRAYFTSIRFRAALERAQANLSMALATAGAKRHICFEYSISTYQSILQELDNLNTEYAAELQEECLLGLAKAYSKNEDDLQAEPLLQQIVQRNQSAGITRGAFLARAHYDLATISMQRHHYPLALDQLRAAEEASKGRILSTDERLSILIRQSLCYRELEDLDSAMRLLSKVINDDSVSGLRLRAMLLRAEVYEQQGRTELAHKQLVALATRGGEWAEKAKEKLEREYGIQ